MEGNPNPRVAAANRGLVYRQANGIFNWTGVVRQLPERLAAPFAWPRPKLAFVNSLSDMLHRDVPPDFIRRRGGRPAGRPRWGASATPTPGG